MTTTDTPHTDAVWKLTPFASALLEHDGETCNEIFCADADEAECLVDLLNSQERTIKKLASRIDRINNDNFYLANTLSKANAEVERLKANLRRAVEIAEGFREILQLDKDSRLGKELNAIKATLNPTDK